MTGYLYRGQPGLEAVNAQIMKARTGGGPAPRGKWADAVRAGHGTDARAKRHRREGERPCRMCLVAERAARQARDTTAWD